MVIQKYVTCLGLVARFLRVVREAGQKSSRRTRCLRVYRTLTR